MFLGIKKQIYAQKNYLCVYELSDLVTANYEIMNYPAGLAVRTNRMGR